MLKRHFLGVSTLIFIAALLFLVGPVSTQAQPPNIHGPGEGFYRTSECNWRGEVWAHNDESGCPDNPQGIWEVGVEGILDGEPQWYTMGFVDSEEFRNDKFVVSGTFEVVEEWPLSDLSFTANLKKMTWKLKGEGFDFKGDIEALNVPCPGSPEPPEPDECLTTEEALLTDMINDYRNANGLPDIPLSKSMVTVAQWHVLDLQLNNPDSGTDPDSGLACNLHSWSDWQPSFWTEVCYTQDHRYAVLIIARIHVLKM